MDELTEADRECIAVAGDADVAELAVGGVGAGGYRGHAAVHRIEAVRAADEIGRGLRGAAYARELHQVAGLDGIRPAGLDDGGGDRIVPAARAQRGIGALVLAPRQPERVLGQVGVGDLGFGHEAHWRTSCAAGRA